MTRISSSVPPWPLRPGEEVAALAASPWLAGVSPAGIQRLADAMDERSSYARGEGVQKSNISRHDVVLRYVVDGLIGINQVRRLRQNAWRFGPGWFTGLEAVAHRSDRFDPSPQFDGGLRGFDVRASDHVWFLEAGSEQLQELVDEADEPGSPAAEVVTALTDAFTVSIYSGDAAGWMVRTGYFSHLPPHKFTGLFPQAEVIALDKGSLRGDVRGVTFTIDGALTVFDGDSETPTTELAAGYGWGIRSVPGGTPYRLRADADSRVLILSEQVLTDAGCLPTEAPRRSFDLRDVASRSGLNIPGAPTVVVPLIEPKLMVDLPPGTRRELTVQLAQTIATHLNDGVMCLTWDPRGTTELPDKAAVPGAVEHGTLRDPEDLPPVLELAVRADVIVIGPGPFLDAGGRGELLARLRSVPVATAVTWLIPDSDTWRRQLVELGCACGVTLLPGHWLPQRVPTLERALHHFTGKYLPPLPLGAFRVQFRPAWLASITGHSPAPTALDPHRDEPTSLQRWARAATGRRVGVALGGAGALSFISFPLIEEMTRLGVPVDVLAGSSFGAVVAGFYAAEGEAGLAKLMRQRLVALLILQAAWLTNRPIGLWVDLLLGFLDVNETLIPAYSVATDSADFTAHEVRSGSIGRGIRASGALPPFAPVQTALHRLLDGAFADNVPGRTVADAGADLTIGANPFAKPTNVPGLQSRVAGPLWNVILETATPLRLWDYFRAEMHRWGLTGEINVEQLDLEFRSPVPFEVYQGSDMIWGPRIAQVARQSPELRHILSELQGRWRARLHNPPGRISWDRDEDEITVQGVWIFSEPSRRNLLTGSTKLTDPDTELMMELAAFVADQSAPEIKRLNVEVRHDLLPADYPVMLIATPLTLAAAAIQHQQARLKAEALATEWKRHSDVPLEATSRPVVPGQEIGVFWTVAGLG